jgi:hypothetical protein
MKRKINIIIFYWLSVFILILVIISYSELVVKTLLDLYSDQTQYGEIANFHDHFEYLNVSNVGIEGFDRSISSLNVLGIGLIYLLLQEYFGVVEILEIAMIVNILAILISAILHIKVCSFSKFGSSSYWLFFLNLPLIYYSQLIGKDTLSITLLYAMLYCFLKNRYLMLLFLGVLGAFIRIQLLAYPLFLLIVVTLGEKRKITYILLYIISSILGVYVMNHSGAIGDITEASNGITSIVHKINEHVLIGNLIANPIRLLQNIMLFIGAPFVGIINGNVLYISMTPLVLYFATNVKYIRKLIKINKNKFNQFSFTLVMVLLMYPIINTRYVALIAPFVILNIYSVKSNITRSDKLKNEKNNIKRCPTMGF